MTQKPHFVPGVPGLCRALCRVFRSCAGCAGSITHARTRKTKTTNTPHKRAHMRIYTRHTRHTRHIVDIYTYFSHTPGTHPGTPGTRARSPLFFNLKKKMMEKTQSKTIRCTPENAAEIQRMVKNWPQLHNLVQDLQAQNLFPGLRGLSITLTGAPSFVAGGVTAVNQINASKAV